MLALAFGCGLLTSCGIFFFAYRAKSIKRQLLSSLDMNLNSGSCDKIPLNNVFPSGPPQPVNMPVPQPFWPMPIPPDYAEYIGPYRRMHQQLNHLGMWQNCQPEPLNNLPFAFTVYNRQKPPGCVPGMEIMVEIHCEWLKKVLKSCILYVDSIFDPTPMV